MLGLFVVAFFLKRVGGHRGVLGGAVSQVLIFALYFTSADLLPLVQRHRLRGLHGSQHRAASRRWAPRGESPASTRDMSAPIICFGQQPCGFFPKRFLVRQDPDRAAPAGRNWRRDRLLLPRQRSRSPRNADDRAAQDDLAAAHAQLHLREPPAAQVLAPCYRPSGYRRAGARTRRGNCRLTSVIA